MKKGAKSHPSSFKFLNMWIAHLDCKRVVAKVWKQQVWGCTMFVLLQKLKNLKVTLKNGNRGVFGNVRARVDCALSSMASIQAQIDYAGSSDALRAQELSAYLELLQALAYVEALWRYKSRVNWFSYGDRNTTFSHKLTKIRNIFKKLSILRTDDAILDNVTDIENHVFDYYASLYAFTNSRVDNGLVEKVIPSIVSSEDNIVLTNLLSFEEVKSAVFSMDKNSSPGPDGFRGCFYQAF